MMHTRLPLTGCLITFLLCFAKATSIELKRRASPADSTPAGYSYVNCYPGYYSNGEVLDSLWASGDSVMTLNACAAACGTTAYFGVTADDCFCGDTILKDESAVVSPDNCMTPCNGNTRTGRQQYCGGAQYTSIFRRDQDFVPPSSRTYNSLGCYVDSPLQFSPNSATPRGATPQICEAICLGFKYFTVEVVSCFCSDDLSFAQIAPTAECNSPCPGDSTQTCGGFGRVVNLYATPQYQACGQVNTDLRVKNPGFENGVAYWSPITSPGVQWQVQTRAEAHTGRRLARIVVKDVGQIQLFQTIPTCPGVQYVLTYFHTLHAGTNGDCATRAYFDGIGLPTSTPSNGGWSQQSSVVTPSGETAVLEIRIGCEGRQSMVFLDDIQLRPATPNDF